MMTPEIPGPWQVSYIFQGRDSKTMQAVILRVNGKEEREKIASFSHNLSLLIQLPLL